MRKEVKAGLALGSLLLVVFSYLVFQRMRSGDKSKHQTPRAVSKASSPKKSTAKSGSKPPGASDVKSSQSSLLDRWQSKASSQETPQVTPPKTTASNYAAASAAATERSGESPTSGDRYGVRAAERNSFEAESPTDRYRLDPDGATNAAVERYGDAPATTTEPTTATAPTPETAGLHGDERPESQSAQDQEPSQARTRLSVYVPEENPSSQPANPLRSGAKPLESQGQTPAAELPGDRYSNTAAPRAFTAGGSTSEAVDGLSPADSPGGRALDQNDLPDKSAAGEPIDVAERYARPPNSRNPSELSDQRYTADQAPLQSAEASPADPIARGPVPEPRDAQWSRPNSRRDQAPADEAISSNPPSQPVAPGDYLPRGATVAEAADYAPKVGRRPSGFATPETSMAGRAGYDGQNEPIKYIVQPNDSFWVISKRLFGDGSYFKAIYEHNRDRFPQQEKMQVGDELIVPSREVLQQTYPGLCPKPRKLAAPSAGAVSAVSADRVPPGPVYVVREGDTLFDIARHELGSPTRWVDIFELNRRVLSDDFDYIRPGTELVLPGRPDRERESLTQRPDGTLPR